jgi:hypothetical protein
VLLLPFDWAIPSSLTDSFSLIDMQPPLPHDHPPSSDYASPESTFSDGPPSEQFAYSLRPVRPLPLRYDTSSQGSNVSDYINSRRGSIETGEGAREEGGEEEGSSVPVDIDSITHPSSWEGDRPHRELTEQERITLTEIRRLTLNELRQIAQAPTPPPFAINFAGLAGMANMNFGLPPPSMEELEGLPPLDVLASIGLDGTGAPLRGGVGAGGGAGDQTFASTNATFALSDGGDEEEEEEEVSVRDEEEEERRHQAGGKGAREPIFGSLERRSSSPVFYHREFLPRHRSIGGCHHQHLHAPGSACSAEGEEGAEDGHGRGEFRSSAQLEPEGRKDFALIEGLELMGEREMISWREWEQNGKGEEVADEIAASSEAANHAWDDG